MSNPNAFRNFQGAGLSETQKRDVIHLFTNRPELTMKKIAETLNVRHGQVAGYIAHQQRKGVLPNRKPARTSGMRQAKSLRPIGPNGILTNSLVQLRLQYSRAVDAKARIETECRELKTAIMALEALTGDKGE